MGLFSTTTNMGAKITKKNIDADDLGNAPFTIEGLGEVKIGLKEVQAKEGGVDLAHWQKVWKKACKLDGEFVDGFFKVFDEADNEWVDFRSTPSGLRLWGGSLCGGRSRTATVCLTGTATVCSRRRS